MTEPSPNACTQALTTPEILDNILSFLLVDIISSTNHDDWRSKDVQSNAQILLHILGCAQITRIWRDCVFHGTKSLRRALFLCNEDESSPRSWDQERIVFPNQQSYYRGLALQAPVLNPVVQTSFAAYKFRYWRSGLGAEGPRHHAYLIITRRHAQESRLLIRSGHGSIVRNMLLAQPPPLEFHATVWELDRDCSSSGKRTTAIDEPVLRNLNGVTLNDVLRHAAHIFDQHADLLSIKFTTV